jgi:hypothetical protein
LQQGLPQVLQQGLPQVLRQGLMLASPPVVQQPVSVRAL